MPSASLPEALIIAGPNGSGKSTFAEEYLRSRAVPFLSADSIAQALSPIDPARARVEAGRQAAVIRTHRNDQGEAIVRD